MYAEILNFREQVAVITRRGHLSPLKRFSTTAEAEYQLAKRSFQSVCALFPGHQTVAL
jgi:hypothetical protein